MIITSAVVIAIVGSAFAFKTKRVGTFCVTFSNSGTPSCYIIHNSKRTTFGGIFRRYYTDWDGVNTLNK